MAMDVATLSIAVESRQVREATNSLNKMAEAGGTVVGVLAKVAAVAGIGLIARQLFETNAEFQRLGASLETVTGSASAASNAFRMIQDFAKATPYELTELTQAFVDLKTRGMDASVGSMTSYGNMASAFGRSLTDLIRAISGVAMGESEAIKSFGVQAMTQGDRISLTFKGQTEVIKRTVTDVEAYFKRLSEANFSGGMERQAKTLGGALSNLKDQIAATFFEIGNSGVSNVMVGAILRLTKAISDATPTIARFAASSIDALATTGRAIARFKVEILALAAIPFAMWVNTSVASVAALIAPMVRTIALTAALSIQAGGFGVAATAAAAGTALWNGALSLVGSTAGMLAIGLAALYIAMKPVMDETKRLNDAVDAQEEKYARLVDPIMKARDRTKELREENERLQKVLGGDKSVKIFGSEAQTLINQIKRVGGDTTWAGIIAKGLDAETQKNAELKAKLDARNLATKEAAAAQEKLRQQSKTYLETLKEEVATYGMSAAQIDAYKAKKLGLLDNSIFKLHQWIAAQKIVDEMMKVENDLAAKNLAEKLKLKDANDAYGQSVFRMFQDAERVTDQFLTPKAGFEKDKTRFDDLFGRGLISLDTYKAAIKSIDPVWTDTFGSMARTLDDFSMRGTDAFVDFCFTGKAQFSDLITSMLRDLARLTVQKNVMGPLFDLLGVGINYLAGGGSSGSTTAQTTYNPGPIETIPTGTTFGSMAATNRSGSTPIIVNVSTDGSSKTTGGEGDMSKLGQLIGAKVREVMVQERRQGGLLAGA